MDYAAARRNMVENQVRTNKVTNPVLIEALETLPRENFVPEALAGVAYVDEALPVSGGRYLLEPMVWPCSSSTRKSAQQISSWK